MNKKMIPVLLLLIIGIGGGLYYWCWGRDRSNELVLRGEVEGTTYSQICEVAGKIIEMPIELGGPVKAGDLIARLDNSDQKYALEQLQIGLEKKRLTMQDLQNGAKQEEIEQARNNISSAEAAYRSAEASYRSAEANYRSAEATYNQALDDIEPYTKLWEAGGLALSELDKVKLKATTAAETLEVAKSQVEAAKSQLEAAESQIGNSKEKLSLLQKGTDAETIAIAAADISETESKIRQMQETLDKYVITANCDGTVISKNYSLGSMVNAGYNLVDISAGNEKYVLCYLPEKESAQVSYGQKVTVRAGKEEYEGEVRFIDVKSQYTPKDMQTSATKNKVSVKVKVLLPADVPLNPGAKVEVAVKPGED